jgi:hypothetical protein
VETKGGICFGEIHEGNFKRKCTNSLGTFWMWIGTDLNFNFRAEIIALLKMFRTSTQQHIFQLK